TICLKCLEKEPKKRYASAAALAADLRRFLAGKAIQARPIGRLGRGWRWARRNPALATAGAVATAALAVAGVVAILLGLHQDEAAERARADELRTRKALEETRRASASMAFEQSRMVCTQGDAGVGLLLLARGLELSSDGADSLRDAVRSNLGAWHARLC